MSNEHHTATTFLGFSVDDAIRILSEYRERQADTQKNDELAKLDATLRKTFDHYVRGEDEYVGHLLTDAIATIERMRPESQRNLREPEDYQTDLEGYDTVLGFLSKHDPFILEMMVDPVEETQRDGFWLMHRARERGLPSLKVPAPKAVTDLYPSIETVKAWPVDLLKERFGH